MTDNKYLGGAKIVVFGVKKLSKQIDVADNLKWIFKILILFLKASNILNCNLSAKEIGHILIFRIAQGITA